MNETQAHAMDALLKTEKAAFVRSTTPGQASAAVRTWATERRLPIVEVSPYYNTDLRGEPFVSGTPPVSGRLIPDWYASVLATKGPQVVLWDDVHEASATMSRTNIAILNSMAKDRLAPMGHGKLPAGILVVATGVLGEGAVPGLQPECFGHMQLD